jgi:hypothetical protein
LLQRHASTEIRNHLWGYFKRQAAESQELGKIIIIHSLLGFGNLVAPWIQKDKKKASA